MLARNLLYTGVTRGRRLVVLVGQRRALGTAVRNGDASRRWSRLREWLDPGGSGPAGTMTPHPDALACRSGTGWRRGAADEVAWPACRAMWLRIPTSPASRPAMERSVSGACQCSLEPDPGIPTWGRWSSCILRTLCQPRGKGEGAAIGQLHDHPPRLAVGAGRGGVWLLSPAYTPWARAASIRASASSSMGVPHRCRENTCPWPRSARAANLTARHAD